MVTGARWLAPGLVAALALVLPGTVPRVEESTVAGELVEAKLEFFYSGAWQDHTDRLYDRDPISIERGIPNEGGRADPGRVSFTINNRDGMFSPRNPRSDLYGLIGRNTPVRISAGLQGGTQSVRFVGEVVQWPTRWDLSGNDIFVPVQAAGILRRLGVPGKPLRTALERQAVDESDVFAYWPLTGLGQDARQAPSPLAGVAPLETRFRVEPAVGAVRGTTIQEWSADETAPELGSLPVTSATQADETRGGGRAQLSFRGDPSRWMVANWIRGRLVQNVDSSELAPYGQTSMIVQVAGSAQVSEWVVLTQVLAPGGDVSSEGSTDVAVIALDEDGLFVAPEIRMEEPFSNRWQMPAVILEQSGSDVDVTWLLNGNQIGTDTFSGVDLGTPVSAQLTAFSNRTQQHNITVSFGHPLLASGSGMPDLVGRLWDAGTGYAGETAADRFSRLCDEEDVTATVVGDPDQSMPMGPQRPRRFLALLDECADAEAAGARLPILTETRDELGLTFRTRESLYDTGAGP